MRKQREKRRRRKRSRERGEEERTNQNSFCSLRRDGRGRDKACRDEKDVKKTRCRGLKWFYPKC